MIIWLTNACKFFLNEASNIPAIRAETLALLEATTEFITRCIVIEQLVK